MTDSAGLRPDDHPYAGHPAELRGPFARSTALVTVSILFIVTVVAFESMALTTVMPAIAEEFHAIRAYGLAFSGLLTAQLVGIVLAGLWTDRHGPLSGLVVGQSLLAVGSIGCALARNFPQFLLGRVLAGLGGGALVVLLYVVVGRVYPEQIRPRVFSLVSAAWILPSLIGAPIAAALTSATSWRVVFWVLVPPIIATTLLIWLRGRTMSSQWLEPAPGSDHADHLRVAWTGVGVAVAAGLFQTGTAHLGRRPDGHLLLTVIGGIGVAVLAPKLVPEGTWRMARGLPAVLASRALCTGAFFGALTYAPLFLVRERHLTLAWAGIAASVGSVGWALGAWVQGLPRFHTSRAGLVTAGGGLLASGLVLLSAIAAFGWPTILVAIPFALAGLGMGLAIASQAVLTLSVAPPEDHGRTASALQLSDVLGSVVGIAGAAVAFAIGHGRHHSDVSVYAEIWLVLAVVAALTVVAGRRISTRA